MGTMALPVISSALFFKGKIALKGKDLNPPKFFSLIFLRTNGVIARDTVIVC